MEGFNEFHTETTGLMSCCRFRPGRGRRAVVCPRVRQRRRQGGPAEAHAHGAHRQELPQGTVGVN